MKRFLSILLSVLMVVSVLAILASCNGNTQEQTTATNAPETTTAAPVTTTAKTDTTTTQAPVTTTATVTETTTAATTTATEKVTTAEVTTVTEVVTTTAEVTTTTAEETTTAKPVETTTLPVFARFDFGTKTYAEDEGLTSHDYLMEILRYDDACLTIYFEEDYWDVWVVSNFDSGNASTDAFGMTNQRWALIFNDIVSFDFDDEIQLGFGGYSGTPYKNLEDIANPVWKGKHQYMQIRLVNNTTNNIWGVRFCKTGDGTYYTTEIMGNLYLQGGEPESSEDYRRTCTPTEEWATYTYDMGLCASLASGRGGAATGKGGIEGLDNYYDYKQYVYATGSIPGGNNVTWTYDKGGFQSLEFHLFGGMFGGTGDNANLSEEQLNLAKEHVRQACDTRANIKSGMNVKVDYIIFGCSPEQLDAWHSYLEDAK